MNICQYLFHLKFNNKSLRNIFDLQQVLDTNQRYTLSILNEAATVHKARAGIGAASTNDNLPSPDAAEESFRGITLSFRLCAALLSLSHPERKFINKIDAADPGSEMFPGSAVIQFSSFSILHKL
ncbi:MAG: hypothetical protein ACOX8M_13250 [Marvinbryantia sp.]|jgi:hypothetical protein